MYHEMNVISLIDSYYICEIVGNNVTIEHGSDQSAINEIKYNTTKWNKQKL